MASDLLLLNPGEVAAILGVDRSTAEVWMVSGEIPSRDISTVPGRRKLRTTRDHVESFVARFGTTARPESAPARRITARRTDQPPAGFVHKSLFR